MTGNGKLVLFWLEEASPWTAPGAHLKGTLARLEHMGVVPDRVIAQVREEPVGNTLGRRVWRLSRLLWQAFFAAQRGTLLARWHPLMVPVVGMWKLRGGRVCLLVQGRQQDLYDSHSFMKWVPGFKWFRGLGVRLADRLAVPAESLRGELAEACGRPEEDIAVIPNGVSTLR